MATADNDRTTGKLSQLTSPQQEMVLNLIMSGKRSAATLVLFRLLNVELESAWEMMNELSDDDRFEKPEQDLGFTNVQNYLKGPGPWKEKKYFYLAAAISFLIGLGVVAYKWSNFQDGVASYWWPITEAEVTHIKFREKRQVRHTGSIHIQQFVDYRYVYNVDGQQYENSIRRQYFPSLGDVGQQLGEVIEIMYAPSAPGKSMHHRNMYQRSLGIVIGLIITLPGLIILAFDLMLTRLDRGFRKVDPILTGLERCRDSGNQNQGRLGE